MGPSPMRHLNAVIRSPEHLGPGSLGPRDAGILAVRQRQRGEVGCVSGDGKRKGWMVTIYRLYIYVWYVMLCYLMYCNVM